ncbi:MAG: DUF4255 domain-containing protein [Pseudomonadota bacterium]
MASFLAVNGAIEALRSLLEARVTEELTAVVTNPTVVQIGPTELRAGPTAQSIGLYLHRVSVDRDGRNRYLAPPAPGQPRQPELPVNLHLLLVAWTETTINEAPLLAWAMQQIGASFELDPTNLGPGDPRWGEEDGLRVTPEDLTTETLLRIWDAIPGDYRLSAPYVLKTVRLEPSVPATVSPPVTTIVLPTGTQP